MAEKTTIWSEISTKNASRFQQISIRFKKIIIALKCSSHNCLFLKMLQPPNSYTIICPPLSKKHTRRQLFTRTGILRPAPSAATIPPSLHLLGVRGEWTRAVNLGPAFWGGSEIVGRGALDDRCSPCQDILSHTISRPYCGFNLKKLSRARYF